MRTLVVGDIHGCYKEFQELLEKSGATISDQIIALGDMIDRGPDSPKVFNFFATNPNAHSLMGNHERKHLGSFQGEIQPAIAQILVREQFGAAIYNQAIQFISKLPNFLELPETILIHGLIEPEIPLPEQNEHVLAGTLSGELYIKRKYTRPWYELYQGLKPVIAGHHDYSKVGQPMIVNDLVYLIDTGCCYGKSLTGVLLPDFKIISIKSKRNYWSVIKQQYDLNKQI